MLAADPVIADRMGQDGANRYSYVYNHPTAFIDPSGFDGEEIGAEDDTSGVCVYLLPGQEWLPDDVSLTGEKIDHGMVDLSSDTSSPTEDSSYEEGEEHAGPSSGGVGAGPTYGDGFTDTTAKFDLVSVKYGQDPASSDGERASSSATWMGWLGLMLMAVLNPPGAIAAGVGAAVVEGAVVVEENLPAIENAEAAIAEAGAAEMSQLSAEASEFGNQLSRLGSYMSEEISAAGRVFWSGPGTSAAANTWAQANGGSTLDAAENMSLAESRQIIDVASRIFAEGASGDVHVFHGTSVDMGSTWAQVEYPALMDNSNVTNIIYHQVQIPIPGQ